MQTVPNDCQIEQAPHTHTRPVPQMNAMSTMPMSSSCIVSDSRHLSQMVSDQEPPEIDDTDPDVIPNQYGK